MLCWHTAVPMTLHTTHSHHAIWCPFHHWSTFWQHTNHTLASTAFCQLHACQVTHLIPLPPPHCRTSHHQPAQLMQNKTHQWEWNCISEHKQSHTFLRSNNQSCSLTLQQLFHPHHQQHLHHLKRIQPWHLSESDFHLWLQKMKIRTTTKITDVRSPTFDDNYQDCPSL